jgi:hypothetical protein
MERGDRCTSSKHGRRESATEIAGPLTRDLGAADRDGDHRRFRMDIIKGLATPMRTSPRARDGCQYCGNGVAREVYEKRWGPSSA